MKIERTKNATRNILWGVIEKMALLLFPFATRMVMIKVLGAEYLGLSSLFTSVLSVLSISELGIGTAIVFSMYKPIAEDDDYTLCALLNTYKKIYHIIGIIILVLGVALTPVLPHLINGSYPSNVNLYILYYVYLFDTVISYFLFAYKTALFSAYQRNDLASKRSTLISIISNAFRILVLVMFRNYYVYVIIIPLTTILTNVSNVILANKMFPNIQCRGEISHELKDSIKKRIVGLLSFKIYGVIFTSVDTIVVSAFLGLTLLAIYNNYYFVQNSIIGFLTILTTSITAGVGNKMVTNTVDENYVDFKKFVFANGWISSWCAVCMVCLYQHFMRWWVGDALVFPFSTMILMVLYFLLPRITAMTFTYREAAGLWWEDRFRPLVATIVNLVANILLVNMIGINGVIISTLICTILINVPWGTHILFKKYFKRAAWEYFMQLIYYLVITLIAGFVTFELCELFPSVGFSLLLLKAAICVVVPNIIFWIFYHRMSEYKYAKGLVKRIIDSMIKNR